MKEIEWTHVYKGDCLLEILYALSVLDNFGFLFEGIQVAPPLVDLTLRGLEWLSEKLRVESTIFTYGFSKDGGGWWSVEEGEQIHSFVKRVLSLQKF